MRPAHRARNKKTIEEFKLENGCSKCGYNKCHNALEFHHTRDKFKTISQMLVEGYGMKRLLEEVDKCTILCSNCHAEEHSKGD